MDAAETNRLPDLEPLGDRKSFQVLASAVLLDVPVYLRKLFRHAWNRRYPDAPWEDKDRARGHALLWGSHTVDLGEGHFQPDPRAAEAVRRDEIVVPGDLRFKNQSTEGGPWGEGIPDGSRVTIAAVGVVVDRVTFKRGNSLLELAKPLPDSVSSTARLEIRGCSRKVFDLHTTGRTVGSYASSKLHMSEADVEAFDSTLLCWTLLNSAHDGRPLDGSNRQGLLHGLEPLRTAVCEFRSNVRNKVAHVEPGFAAKANVMLRQTVNLLQAADDMGWFPAVTQFLDGLKAEIAHTEPATTDTLLRELAKVDSLDVGALGAVLGEEDLRRLANIANQLRLVPHLPFGECTHAKLCAAQSASAAAGGGGDGGGGAVGGCTQQFRLEGGHLTTLLHGARLARGDHVVVPAHGRVGIISNVPYRSDEVSVTWDSPVATTWYAADEWGVSPYHNMLNATCCPSDGHGEREVPVRIHLHQFRVQGLRSGQRVVLQRPAGSQQTSVYCIVDTVDGTDVTCRVDNESHDPAGMVVTTKEQHVGFTSQLQCVIPVPPQRLRVGTKLLVVHDHKLWDAQVEGPHAGSTLSVAEYRLSLRGAHSDSPVEPAPAPVTDIVLTLNPFNYCRSSSLSAHDFLRHSAEYNRDVLESLAKVEDAVTGNFLSMEQLGLISMRLHASAKLATEHTDEGTWGASSIASRGDAATESPPWGTVLTLAAHLLCGGSTIAASTYWPPARPVLLCATAGTGKSWAVKQLLYLVAKHAVAENKINPNAVPLVPFVVEVQKLAPLLRAATRPPADGDCGLLAEFIRHNVQNPERAAMLITALQLRRLVLCIDGIDEAAGFQHEIENYVLRTLAPLGLRLMVTSRPTGVRVDECPEYNQFLVLELLPLTVEQQLECTRMQLRKMQDTKKLVKGKVGKQLVRDLLGLDQEDFGNMAAGDGAVTPNDDGPGDVAERFRSDVRGNPVMLSLVVLVLRDDLMGAALHGVPVSAAPATGWTTLQLYRRGMEAALRARGWQNTAELLLLLRHVAVHVACNCNFGRSFSCRDVVNAVMAEPWRGEDPAAASGATATSTGGGGRGRGGGGCGSDMDSDNDSSDDSDDDDRLLDVWRKLWVQAQKDNAPLLRPLAVSGSGHAANDQDTLEFKHRSFQEALLGDALRLNDSGAAAFWTDAGVMERLADKTYANVFQIGGCELGKQCLQELLRDVQSLPGGWDDDENSWQEDGWEAERRRTWWRAVQACSAVGHLGSIGVLDMRRCAIEGAWHRDCGARNSTAGTVPQYACDYAARNGPRVYHLLSLCLKMRWQVPSPHKLGSLFS